MKTKPKKTDGKEATHIMQSVVGKFYEMLMADMSPEERKALSDRVKAETAFPAELGAEIQKGMFVFNCPETGSLITQSGFNVHGNTNPDTGEIEAILTVDCKSCKKEHPITVISFSEMVKMPLLVEPDNKG
jgi:hypothetical protein